MNAEGPRCVAWRAPVLAAAPLIGAALRKACGGTVLPFPTIPRMTIRERLSRQADAAELRELCRRWQRHAIAEDRPDVDGLAATLAPDCVCEIIGTIGRMASRGGAR
jgi:hypothetical protein